MLRDPRRLKTRDEIARQLRPYERMKAAEEREANVLRLPPPVVRNATWVEPELVIEVRYNEMTEGGRLRQPVFIGLRDDKRATDVKLEVARTGRRRSA